MLDHIRPQIIADRIRIPDRPSQQVLHPIGLLLARVFGELPAILPLDRADEPSQIRRRTLPRFCTRNLLPNLRRDDSYALAPEPGLFNRRLILTPHLFHHNPLCHLSRRL